MAIDYPRALGRALAKAGLTATQIGRALKPEARKQTLYSTGQRILDGSHPIMLDRLGELASGLGVTVRIDGSGVTVEMYGQTSVSYDKREKAPKLAGS